MQEKLLESFRGTVHSHNKVTATLLVMLHTEYSETLWFVLKTMDIYYFDKVIITFVFHQHACPLSEHLGCGRLVGTVPILDCLPMAIVKNT